MTFDAPVANQITVKTDTPFSEQAWLKQYISNGEVLSRGFVFLVCGLETIQTIDVYEEY